MKCVQCGFPAFFELGYSGHSLCKSHFSGLFERRVKKTIRQSRLVVSGDHVLVALSGGTDSMVCLQILKDTFSKNPRITLSAVSFDEGEGGRDVRGASEFARKLGVPHDTVQFRDFFGMGIDGIIAGVGAKESQACGICGELKSALLAEHAKKIGATKVAIGSNLDDEIRSAFLSIMGLEGANLAPILRKLGVKGRRGSVPVIKILRQCPENEVLAYADILKLPPKRAGCPHSRSSPKSAVGSMLDGFEKLHPGSKYQMFRSAEGMANAKKGRQRD